MALWAEASLATVGLLLAWLTDLPLGAMLLPEAGLAVTAAWGVVATLPLLFLLRVRWRPLVRLRRLVRRMVRPLLAPAAWWQLALLALVAGVSEEILFRGALQPLAVRYTTPLVGLVATSLLFGAAHAASWAYFGVATLVSLYWGGLTLLTGEIVSVAISHALYDFVALMILCGTDDTGR